mgnify:CR=1 FL=1
MLEVEEDRHTDMLTQRMYYGISVFRKQDIRRTMLRERRAERSAP